MTAAVDEIWMEVSRLRGEEREKRLSELCAEDAALEARVRSLLPAEDEAFAPPLEPPCRLGPYTLLERIAGGAHGDVYRATCADLDGQVAVKILRRLPGAPELIAEVRREASSARRISSANVVAVHGAGRIDGGPYYIEMALCADADPERPGAIRLGSSLRHVAAGAAGQLLPPEEAARLVEDAARGVEAAHRAGVVHGDIKPENVLVTPETRRVMLADFGVATTLARHDGAPAPDGLVRAGTVEYMAPEQFCDGRVPDAASDVYMLGGTLLFALAGEVPHPGRRLGPQGALDAARIPVPRRAPERLAEIVEHAMDPDPSRRYRTAGEMAEELRRFRALLPTKADLALPHRRAALFARRNASVLSTLALALAVSAALGLAGYRVLVAAARRSEARVRVLEAQRAELVEDGKVLDAANADLGKRRAELEEQVRDLEKRIQASRAQLDELPKLRVEVAAARGDAAARQQAAVDTERIAADLRARLDATEAARRAGDERAARLEGELAAAQRAADRLGADLAAARDRADRLGRAEAERDQLRERTDALQARVEALQRDLGGATERFEGASRSAEDLRARLRDAEKRAAAALAQKKSAAAGAAGPASPAQTGAQAAAGSPPPSASPAAPAAARPRP